MRRPPSDAGGRVSAMSDSVKAAARLWVRRSAFVYALGVWTVLSYYLSQSLFRGQTDAKDPNPQPQDWQGKENNLSTIASEDGMTDRAVYFSPGQRMCVTTQTTYKKDFVPYTTRLQNFLSFSNESDNKAK